MICGFMLEKKKNLREQNLFSQGDAESGQLIQGLSELYSPCAAEDIHVRNVADVLLEMGKISTEQFQQISVEQTQKPASDIVQIILKLKLATPEDILMAKAELYGYQFRHITPEQVDSEIFKKLDLNYIKNNRMMCVAVEDGRLVVATSRPMDVFAIDDVKRITQMNLQVVVCTDENIDAVCEALDDSSLTSDIDDLISDMADVEIVKDQNDEPEDLEKMAGESPVIKFVNYLISNAIHEQASDIHIEPKEKYSRIRYRIDGVLFEVMQSPVKMHSAIISRLKIMSNLDISERRLPQDGKIAVIIGGKGIDLRVSTLPTSHGEKIVIRVLDRSSILRGLEQLGMQSSVLKTFEEQILLPHGIMLVTGPTGSGKSTTLYSALAQMDGDTLNISTVEDPVEYELEFCNQVQVNEKIGMTFASALRSLLRQDPDIIMIGEIRDNETARIATQAALTGHLVLSTLHTNDAPSSVTRLVNIGIEPYLVSASLNAVLAQRLVRRICPECQEKYEVSKNMRKYVERAGINPDQLMRGRGCDNCRESGYAGRLGIYELLVVDEWFRDMINKASSVSNMKKAFAKTSQISLHEDGIEKVKQGLTTIEEVLRVTEIYGKNSNEEFTENIGRVD